MAKSAVIPQDIEEIIFKLWQSHLENGWTAKEIQVEVAKEVQAKWPGKYQSGWPGVRSIQNKISGMKGKMNMLKFQQSWHLGTLEESPLSADVIIHVLNMQNWVDIQKQKKLKSDDLWLQANRKHLDITIKQAQWIARLYHLFPYQVKNKKEMESALYWLWTWSKVYTIAEVFSQLFNKDFNTATIDKALREGWTAQVLAWDYFLAPRDENKLGIFGGATTSYHFDEPLENVIKKQKEGGK